MSCGEGEMRCETDRIGHFILLVCRLPTQIHPVPSLNHWSWYSHVDAMQHHMCTAPGDRAEVCKLNQNSAICRRTTLTVICVFPQASTGSRRDDQERPRSNAHRLLRCVHLPTQSSKGTPTVGEYPHPHGQDAVWFGRGSDCREVSSLPNYSISNEHVSIEFDLLSRLVTPLSSQ